MIQNGERNDVFQVEFDKGTVLNGILDSNNEIASVIAFIENDGGPETSLNNMLIQEALISIFYPTVTTKEILAIQEKLQFIKGYSKLQEQIGQSFNETVNNIKFSSEFKEAKSGDVLCIFGAEVLD